MLIYFSKHENIGYTHALWKLKKGPKISSNLELKKLESAHTQQPLSLQHLTCLALYWN